MEVHRGLKAVQLGKRTTPVRPSPPSAVAAFWATCVFPPPSDFSKSPGRAAGGWPMAIPRSTLSSSRWSSRRRGSARVRAGLKAGWGWGPGQPGVPLAEPPCRCTYSLRRTPRPGVSSLSQAPALAALALAQCLQPRPSVLPGRARGPAREASRCTARGLGPTARWNGAPEKVGSGSASREAVAGGPSRRVHLRRRRGPARRRPGGPRHRHLQVSKPWAERCSPDSMEPALTSAGWWSRSCAVCEVGAYAAGSRNALSRATVRQGHGPARLGHAVSDTGRLGRIGPTKRYAAHCGCFRRRIG
jgi:hypothetical protein